MYVSPVPGQRPMTQEEIQRQYDAVYGKKPPIVVQGQQRKIRVQPPAARPQGDPSVIDRGDASEFARRGVGDQAVPVMGMDYYERHRPAEATGLGIAPVSTGFVGEGNGGSYADEALWRTLAPARANLPPIHRNAAQVPPGSYTDTGAGLVRMGDEIGLGGSDNVAHQAAAMRRYIDQNRARTMGPMPGGGVDFKSYGETAAPLAQEFGGLVNLAKGNFDADTQRAQQAINEYDKKIRGPEQDLAELAKTELQGQAQRDTARIGMKAASQAALTQSMLEAARTGQTTEEQRNLLDTYKALENEMRGTPLESAASSYYGDVYRQRMAQRGILPPVQVQGAQQPITVTGPSPPTPATTPTLEDINRRKQTRIGTNQLLTKAFAMEEGERGTLKGGKYEIDKLVDALKDVDPTMLGEEQLGVVISQALKSGATLPNLLTDLSKAYIKHARGAGKDGKWKIQVGEAPPMFDVPGMGWFKDVYRDVSLVDANGNPIIVGRENFNPNQPGLGEFASGTQYGIGPWTAKGGKLAEQRRDAAERLLDALFRFQARQAGR